MKSENENNKTNPQAQPATAGAKDRLVKPVCPTIQKKSGAQQSGIGYLLPTTGVTFWGRRGRLPPTKPPAIGDWLVPFYLWNE